MEPGVQQETKLSLNGTVFPLTLRPDKEKGQVPDLPLHSDHDEIVGCELNPLRLRQRVQPTSQSCAAARNPSIGSPFGTNSCPT